MGEKFQSYNWGRHNGSTSPVRVPREYVEIDDETLRDGLQGTQLTTHPTRTEKQIYLQRASPFIDHADIGFPGSEPEHQNEVEQLMRFVIAKGLNISLSAAARGAVRSDIEPFADLSQRVGYPLEADIFFDGSRQRAEIQKWDRSKMLHLLGENIDFLKKHELPVMFVPERATSTPPDELLEVCKIAAEHGTDRICIADTQGIAGIRGIQNILRWSFEEIGDRYPNLQWDAHFHNDRGLGIAHCLTAAEEGIDRVHATIFCIGERAGNVDLGLIAVNLNMSGYRNTNLLGFKEFTDIAASLLDYQIPVNAPVYGPSAHTTASGVHASAMYKEQQGGVDPSMYFAYPPQSVGMKPGVEVGPFSGTANVLYKLDYLGIDLSDYDQDKLNEVIEEIMSVAKHGRGILPDETIRGVVHMHANGKHRE